MINGLLAPQIIKTIFRVALWLLIWIEVDLFSRLMLGINLSPAQIPLGDLHGIGRWVPFGSMVALIAWLLQLMLIAGALRKFGLVKWTPYDKREASYLLGDANGVRGAGPNWNLPGEELVTVEQSEKEMVFVLGPNDERINTKDKIVTEGLIRFFAAPANIQVVTAWGGMDALLSGKLRSIALDILDRAVQKHDYEAVMDEAGSGKFGMKLKAAMEAITPTEEERDFLAKFPGLERHARTAKTALEIYGVVIPRVNAHLDENASIAEAARKGKEAKELVSVAKFAADAERKRAIGDRAAAAIRANMTQEEYAKLPLEQRLELLRIGSGQSTSTTERKSFDIGPDAVAALTGIIGLRAAVVRGRDDKKDDSKDDS